MILHLIQTSPVQDNGLQSCWRYACPKGDTILLTGNGINALLYPDWQSRLKDRKVKVLTDDAIARGLLPHIDPTLLLDYDQFVRLSLTHDKVISW